MEQSRSSHPRARPFATRPGPMSRRGRGPFHQERRKDLELNLRLELKRKHPEGGFSVGSSDSLAKISGRKNALYYSNASSIQKSVRSKAMTAKELSGVLFLECFTY